MKKRNSIAIAGGLLGFLAGSSIGIAAGGTAINGAWVLALIAALIGWLLGRNLEADSERSDASQPSSSDSEEAPSPYNAQSSLASVLRGGMEFAASLWNLHIDLLDTFKLLKTFCEKPWFFVALAVAGSLFFPPFGVAYFFAYICASQMGANKATQYRAELT